MKYKLSEDERVLTVIGEHGGETTMGWDHPVTQEELENALRTVPALLAEREKQAPPGTHNLHRRYVTRWGSIFVSLLAGPPTWWFPRVLIEKGPVVEGRWSICVGWLRRGIAVAFWTNERREQFADTLDYWKEQR